MEGKPAAGYNIRQSTVFIKKFIKIQIIIADYKFNIDIRKLFLDVWCIFFIQLRGPQIYCDRFCIFFFCNFLRDFRLIFRWKAVVDSVQFRVILNITTKRFDVASWHAEMLRFGRRPTAADAAARNAPSREKATLENPQIFQSCKSKNFISAAIARAKRRQFQIVHPTNERSLTYLESTTP